MKMKLYFYSPEEYIFICDVTDLQNAMSIISDLIKDKIYYYRCWNSEYLGEKAVCIDYGSHVNFFYLVGGNI